jgi:PKD repeat protein
MNKTLCLCLVLALLALLAGCDVAPSGGRAPRAVIEASSLRGTAPLIVAYDWTFDGQLEGEAGPRCTHTFGTAGTHEVALTVRDADGNSATAHAEIVADNAPPLASLRLSDGAPVVHTSMTADGSGSVDPEGQPLAFSWDFGDGGSAQGAVVTHIYDEIGAYTVTLVVRDAAGAEASASHRVLVQTPPSGGCSGGRPIAL